MSISRINIQSPVNFCSLQGTGSSLHRFVLVVLVVVLVLFILLILFITGGFVLNHEAHLFQVMIRGAEAGAVLGCSARV